MKIGCQSKLGLTLLAMTQLPCFLWIEGLPYQSGGVAADPPYVCGVRQFAALLAGGGVRSSALRCAAGG
jgi:hypothetical protein